MNDNTAKLMVKARTKLLMDATFYGSISMGLKLREDYSAFKLWTDGEYLGYNPDVVEQMPSSILHSAIGELVLHIAHKHHLRMIDKDPNIWNKACDNVVMDILRMSGKFIIPPEYDREEVARFRGMNAEAVYKVLYDEAPKDPDQNGDKDGDGEGESDQDQDQDQENSGGGNSGEDSEEEKEDSDSGKDEQSPSESDEDSENGENENNGEDSDQGSENDSGNGSSSQDNENEDKNDDKLDENSNGSGNGNNSEQSQKDEGTDQEENQDTKSGQGEVRTPQSPSGKKSLTKSELEQLEQNLERTVNQAEAVAKNMGQDTLELDRLIKDLRAPIISWSELLARFMEKSAKNDYSWTVPNHRYIHMNVILPSMRSNEIGTAIVVVDSSGSVTEEELKMFASEISYILDTYQNIEVDVMYCAYDLDPNIDHFTHQDFPITLKPHVWGGTSFAPPFNYIRDNMQDPTCLIYFTDMGSSRYPDFIPKYPVLWINTSNSLYYGEPPFGDLIYMDNRK